MLSLPGTSGPPSAVDVDLVDFCAERFLQSKGNAMLLPTSFNACLNPFQNLCLKNLISSFWITPHKEISRYTAYILK